MEFFDLASIFMYTARSFPDIWDWSTVLWRGMKSHSLETFCVHVIKLYFVLKPPRFLTFRLHATIVSYVSCPRHQGFWRFLLTPPNFLTILVEVTKLSDVSSWSHLALWCLMFKLPSFLTFRVHTTKLSGVSCSQHQTVWRFRDHATWLFGVSFLRYQAFWCFIFTPQNFHEFVYLTKLRDVLSSSQQTF